MIRVPAALPAQSVRWHVFPDDASLLAHALARVLAAAHKAIAQHGAFDIVLAGGNTPRKLYRALRHADTDWTRWHIWYGDERCAPPNDPERNSKMARDEWLDHVAIPVANVHAIPAEHGARDAAVLYARELRAVDTFDLVLLGLGEDGHTASLFPGHDWGAHTDSPDVLAVSGAPKPPPERVSLGAQRLSNAHQVLFLVEGAGKRDAVAAWKRGDTIPAASIAPEAGVDVLLDTAAA
ncbi:MAG: 6-phosphogluconolactonase, eukaryotic type [Rhodanobacteraceae bacterium]|jgi:6-phosphogluconolactonase|nr:MAG: 6-phosphogluconolactonase, eukaryotic type [Rhodanobacteraceae bacterium]